jgi:Domain of unknown function (DUF4336)
MMAPASNFLAVSRRAPRATPLERRGSCPNTRHHAPENMRGHGQLVKPRNMRAKHVAKHARKNARETCAAGPLSTRRRLLRRECLRLLAELNLPVEYIILPTFAYEHKVFVGPFSRRFPKARVYVAPRQWSWPLNLPLSFFGIFPAGVLSNDRADYPWSDELDHKVFASTFGVAPLPPPPPPPCPQ